MHRSFILLIVTVLTIPISSGCESDGTKSSAKSAQPAAAAKTLSPEARRNDVVYAYVDAIRADLSDGKAELINQVMRLSREESARFWPIYHDYEDELFALGDQRVEMTRKFVTAQTAQSLDDARAGELANEWFDFEEKRLELLRKYHKRIAAELSPLRAAQFTQVEHRVGTVIDLLIASELPLVRTPPRNSSTPPAKK